LHQLQDEQKGSPESPTSVDDSGRSDLLQQLLEATQKELAVTRAQLPVFERFAKAPRFDQGGIMPGSPLEHYPAWVAGQERLTPQGQLGPSEPPIVTLVVEKGAGVDETKIRAEVDGQLAQIVRKARSGPAPGHKVSFPK